MCLSFFSLAQSDSTRRLFSVHVSPAIFSSYNYIPGGQAGLQYRFAKDWGAAAEVGLPLVPSGKPRLESETFVRFSGEIKKYTRSASPKERGYISLQGEYIYRRFVDTSGGYVINRPFDSSFRYRSALIYSPVTIAALKLGTENRLGKRWLFDLFLGGGIRSVHTKYRNIVERITQEPLTRKDLSLVDPTKAYQYNGTVMRPHFTLGFRLGWITSEK